MCDVQMPPGQTGEAIPCACWRVLARLGSFSACSDASCITCSVTNADGYRQYMNQADAVWAETARYSPAPAQPASTWTGSVLETKSFFAALPRLMLISSLPVLPITARTPPA